MMTTDFDSFESFLMHLAIAFVNMPPDKIDEEFDKALAMTGKFTSVDRSYVMSYDFETGLVRNTHEWCAEGVIPMIDQLQSVPIDGIESEWVDLHRRGEIVHISDVQALESESPLRQILEPQGILTLVAVPMFYQGMCLGFVGFDAVKQRIEWSNEQLTLVRMLAELFTNAEMCRQRVQTIRHEQSKAESASRLLEKAVEATGIAVWQIELDRPVAFMVTGWNSLLNVDWDGRHIDIDEFRAWVHPEDLEEIDLALARSAGRPQHSETVEFRVRTRNSTWRSFRSWWVCEVDAVTRSSRLYGGTMDVSESSRRTQSHQLLSQISARFVDLESYHDGLDSAMGSIRDFCGAKAANLFLLDDPGDPFQDGGTSELNDHDARLSDLWLGKCLAENGQPDGLATGSVVAFECDHAPGSAGSCSTPAFSTDRDCAVFVPLMVGGRFQGAIALLHDSSASITHAATDDFLRSCSDIVGGAIARLCAEKSLRESVKLHQRILNNLNDVIFLTDLEGRITFINDAGRDFCGTPTSSVLGHRITRWIQPMNPRDAEQLESRGPGSGQDRNTVMQVRDGNRRERHIAFSRHALRNERGVITGFLSTVTDVTVQRNWEESLIAEKIKAESTNDAKTLYLSNLSHEIRTPMHGVLGMLEVMMRRGQLSRKDMTHAEAAHESCRNLLRLFDDVLDIAKLERGVMQLHPSDVDLRKVIERSVLIFQKELTAKALMLDLNFAPDLPERIVIDELRLRQILCNLISNAIRYTESGRVSVSIEMRDSQDRHPASNGRILRLLVVDTGIGIASDDIGSLFQPFVQINRSPGQSAAEGSGLGLSITQQLLSLMSGSIDIRSQVGIGTTVEVNIPLVIPQRNASRCSSGFGLRDDGYKLQGISVLVAEDNDISRILACEHLAEMGCDFIAVENGLKAVAESQKRRFHFIIMDCAMPVLDGFHASRRILSAHEGGSPPIIIGCTANPSGAAVAKCLSAGMQSVLVKPYTRRELAQLLQANLQAAAPGSQAALKNDEPEAKSGEPPRIDLEIISALEDQLAGSDLTFGMLVNLFGRTSTQQIDDILQAAAKGDWRTCGRTAHSLKGGSLSIGASRLASLCSKIEASCHVESDRSAISSLGLDIAERLMSEHAEVMQALDQRIRTDE